MRRTVLSLLVVVAFASVAAAEWSDDPAENLAVADRTGSQVQPKVHATSDGGCYVSWYDNNAGGYDVYLQRLDAVGNELWAHNGVLVADRSFSWTNDYDLDVDATNNAYLTFRDDRSGTEQITVAKVNGNGTLEWGPDGVQVTSGTDYVAAPKLAVTTDDNVVVGWSSEEYIRMQKLDPSGTPLWGPGVTLSDTGDGSFSFCDINASDSGSIIASWIRQGPNYWDPRHLWAQKFSSAGSAMWGLTPVIVFDGGSLQMGNFPGFIADGSGGGVFTWYNVSPLQCYVQRVLADGTEAFAHNGVVASTNGSQTRAGPSISFNPTTEEIFLFWREMDPGQSQDGIYGQKFSSDGTRQWTDYGKEVRPVSGATNYSQVRNLQYADGAYVFFVEAIDWNNDRVWGALLDSDGDDVWSPSPIEACSVVAGNSNLFAALNPSDVVLLAWQDTRNDDGDIYAQNVNPDGTLGILPEPIPTVSEWAMVLMTLLVLAAGAIVSRTARAPAS